MRDAISSKYLVNDILRKDVTLLTPFCQSGSQLETPDLERSSRTAAMLGNHAGQRGCCSRSWGGTSTFLAGQSSRWRCTSPSTKHTSSSSSSTSSTSPGILLQLHLLHRVPTPLFLCYPYWPFLRAKYIINACVVIWLWNFWSTDIFPAAGFWPQRVTCLSLEG